jgi:prophage maintenance system killer protein
MSRIAKITSEEFKTLVAYAQKSHFSKNEPIPELIGDNLEKVESCLTSPFQTFQGLDLYRGFVAKAAVLFYLLIKNHPLRNGNKRMAILTLAYFYQ